MCSRPACVQSRADGRLLGLQAEALKQSGWGADEAEARKLAAAAIRGRYTMCACPERMTPCSS